MTTCAVLWVLDVKNILSVVAFTAESTFVHLTHRHFVRTLGHLEKLVVAGVAHEAIFTDMRFMAEDDRRCISGREGQISAANHLRKSEQRDRHVEYDHETHKQTNHSSTLDLNVSLMLTVNAF